MSEPRVFDEHGHLWFLCCEIKWSTTSQWIPRGGYGCAFPPFKCGICERPFPLDFCNDSAARAGAGVHIELPHWVIIAVPGAYRWRFWVCPERDSSTIAHISPHMYESAAAAILAGEEWTVLEEWRRRKAAQS